MTTTTADAAAQQPGDQLILSLQEHNIHFVLPAGVRLEAAKLESQCGVLIQGVFVGDIICKTGSLIIAREGTVAGNVSADAIYIEGTLLPPRAGERIKAVGRQLIAASSLARINADLHAQAFSLDRVAKLWGQLVCIEDGQGRSS